MAPLRIPDRALIVAVLAVIVVAASAAPTANSAAPGTPAAEEDPLQKLAPAVLKVARECLSKEYNALACWKLFLVRRADGFLGDVKTSETKQTAGTPSFELLPGFVALEKDARRQDNEILDELEDLGGLGGIEAKDDVQGQDLGQDDDEVELLDPGRDQESLDRALIARTSKLFAGRHVSVKVLPGVALKLSPRMSKDQSSVDADVSVEVGPGFSVGRMKMKNLSPVFLLPPLMFMGMMPFMLATIKGMVVKAMMLNQVAFMSTLWMTVRDVVFGPRPIVKYYNYGYKPHRPPVHFRHPPPPVHHVEHVEHEEHAELQHHHSEPVHFEHHHEELHLPHHRVEHHVEHHETHGASPFFHDESGTSSEDYAQDLGYIGSADDRNDRDDRRGAHGAHAHGTHAAGHATHGVGAATKHGQHTQHVVDAQAADEEDDGGAPSPLPQASPYRRHPAYQANRLRYARTAA